VAMFVVPALSSVSKIEAARSIGHLCLVGFRELGQS
jgi:hypothetical protein